jgi:DNA-binding transcriptional regulator YhcF (GntR family)
VSEPPERQQRGEIGPADLEVAIDRDAEVPIGVQLAWALRARIGAGELKPGERLPALRDLAQATGVNVNTARVVYQRLEQEGLIETRKGSGTFVAPTFRQASGVSKIAASAARKAHQIGVDPREVAAALYVSAEPSDGVGEAQAERRAQLRAQIGALEQALGDIEAEHPGAGAVASSARTSGGPALLGVGELEQVRARLVQRLSAVQAAIDAQVAEGRPQAARTSKGRNSERAPATDPKPAPRRRGALRGAAAEGIGAVSNLLVALIWLVLTVSWVQL